MSAYLTILKMFIASLKKKSLFEIHNTSEDSLTL